MHAPTGALVLLIALTSAGRALGGGEDVERRQRAADQLRRGIALLEAGDYAGAEERFRDAISLAPEKGAPHFYLGKSLALQRRCDEAVPELELYLDRTDTGELSEEAARLVRGCQEQPVTGSSVAPTGTSVTVDARPRPPRIIELLLGREAGYGEHSPSGAHLGGQLLGHGLGGEVGVGASVVLFTGSTPDPHVNRAITLDGTWRVQLLRRGPLDAHLGGMVCIGLSSFEEPFVAPGVDTTQSELYACAAPEVGVGVPLSSRFEAYLLARANFGITYGFSAGELHGARSVLVAGGLRITL